MKKRLTLLVFCAVLLLYGCAPNVPELTEPLPKQTEAPPPETEPTGLPDYEISLSVENVSSTGTGVTLVATHHGSPYAWPAYGVDFVNHYTVEYWDGTQWIRLTLPPYSGVDIGWGVGNGQTKQWDLNWRGDRALPNGKYRILEECCNAGDPSSPVRAYYTEPFDITGSADPWGVKLFSHVSLEAKNGGALLVGFRFPGGVTGEVSADDSFWLEYRNADSWEVVQPKNPYSFSGEVTAIPVNDVETVRWTYRDFGLTEVYGELPDGDYRIGKTFRLSRGEELVVYDHCRMTNPYGLGDTAD